MKEMLKFYNRNASSIRNLIIARCPWLEEDTDLKSNEDCASTSSNQNTPGNPLSSRAQLRTAELENTDYERPFNYSEEFRRELDETFGSESSSELDDFTDVGIGEDIDIDDDLYEPKYLIFSTGSKTYSPHQIGLKKLLRSSFPKKLEPGPSIKERVALHRRRRELEQIIEQLSPEEARLQFGNFNMHGDPDWGNYESVANRFDKIDALIDLEGHIIGMALCPENRFLYVNSRPWPQNSVITNPLESPPISQEIDIHVIDLQTLKKVGTMLRAHKAYTPSSECFFIFLDVCDDFVGSGAEDKNAYVWDSKLKILLITLINYNLYF